MADAANVDRTLRMVDAARDRLRVAMPGPLRAPLAELAIDEVWTSMRLAGTPLERSEAVALIRRGVAVGAHALEAYVRVADYANAARFVREAPSSSRRRGYLTMDELVTLHALAMRRSSERPGRLRETTRRVFPSGMIASPAWLIPQSLAALVDRLHAGPPPATHPLAWIADAHARYERIQPFPDANGRVGRLLMNLLLKRCGYVPFVFRSRTASPYLNALRAADSRDAGPFTVLLARSLARSYAFLTAALPDEEAAQPLSALATGPRRAALYKAAQRNRLRAFRRDGRLMTTLAWIEEYENGQAPVIASAIQATTR